MQARFSLQGELLAPDTDLPTHLGLHHHGEEAEVRRGLQGALDSSQQVPLTTIWRRAAAQLPQPSCVPIPVLDPAGSKA